MQLVRITTKVVSSIPPRWGVLDTTLCDNVCQRQVGGFLQFRPPINLIRQFLLLLRRVSLVEQELLTLMEHMSSPPVFSGVRVDWSLVFCVVFCRSLFVLLSFFFWPLCCLSFDLRILIALIWCLQTLLRC
jgi:hypothetical protein